MVDDKKEKNKNTNNLIIYTQNLSKNTFIMRPSRQKATLRIAPDCLSVCPSILYLIVTVEWNALENPKSTIRLPVDWTGFEVKKVKGQSYKVNIFIYVRVKLHFTCMWVRLIKLLTL